MRNNNEQLPCKYTMSLVAGKWKMDLLFALSRKNVLRYGELKKNLPDITHKMLSAQLKELEQSSLINRKAYNQIPPKVEYSLTVRGKSLIPVLIGLCQWGKNNCDSDSETTMIRHRTNRKKLCRPVSN